MGLRKWFLLYFVICLRVLGFVYLFIFYLKNKIGCVGGLFVCFKESILKSGCDFKYIQNITSMCHDTVAYRLHSVPNDWCNKGRDMCYPVCGMVHIKEPLLLIVNSSLYGGNRFPFSLSEWSLTICLTPCNRK